MQEQDIQHQVIPTQREYKYPENPETFKVILTRLLQGIKRSPGWGNRIQELDLHTLIIMLHMSCVADNGISPILGGYIKRPTGLEHKDWETTKQEIIQTNMISEKNGSFLLRDKLLRIPHPMDEITIYIGRFLGGNTLIGCKEEWKHCSTEEYYKYIPTGAEITEEDIAAVILPRMDLTQEEMDRGIARAERIAQQRKENPDYNPYTDSHLP